MSEHMPVSPIVKESGRIRSIQYLRAVAALSVVAFHSSERVRDALPDTVSALTHLGHGGIDLFFVISGFIMWNIGSAAPRDPAQFLLKRAIRVVPMYWIATLAWVFLSVIMGFRWITITPAHVVESLLFIPHWSPTFSHRFWPVLVPGWTLIFEMFFYAVFSFVLLFTRGWRLPVISVALLALVAVGVLMDSPIAAVNAYTSPLLLEFLAGCLIGNYWRKGQFNPRFGLLLLLLGIAVLVTLSRIVTPDQTSWSRPLIFGSAGALIVWGALCLEEILPDIPVMERLGDASYAIYLFHLFVVQALLGVAVRLHLTETFGGALVFIFVCLLFSSLLGLWLFRVLERPLQSFLLRGLSRRRSSFAR